MLTFDAEATRGRLPLPALVDALREAFARGCVVPARHVHDIADAAGAPAGTMLLMPAWRPGARLGLKTVNVFPGNAARGQPSLHGVYLLFDAGSGVPLAQFDGTELTTRRTVAVSALAASYLARDDARRLLVVGAGRLASAIAEAMRVVRPGLAQVDVWARRPAAAARLAAELAARGFDAHPVADLDAAAGAADIVSCATLASAALVPGRALRPGTHLDLMGAFTPAMREVDGEAVARAEVYVDTDEALHKAGDLVQAAAEGLFVPPLLRGTLAQLCRGERAGRRSATTVTLFKSVGTALADLAAAELGYDPPQASKAPS